LGWGGGGGGGGGGVVDCNKKKTNIHPTTPPPPPPPPPPPQFTHIHQGGMYSHEERHRSPAGTNKSVSLHSEVVHHLMTMLLHILAPDTILHLLLTQLELQHKAIITMIARLIDPHTQLCFRLPCFRLPFCPSVVHSVTTEHVSRIHTCTWYGSSRRNMHLRELHA